MIPILPIVVPAHEDVTFDTTALASSSQQLYEFLVAGEHALRVSSPEDSAFAEAYEIACEDLTEKLDKSAQYFHTNLALATYALATSLHRSQMGAVPLLSASEMAETVDGLLYIATGLCRLNVFKASPMEYDFDAAESTELPHCDLRKLMDPLIHILTAYPRGIRTLAVLAKRRYDEYGDHAEFDGLFAWPEVL